MKPMTAIYNVLNSVLTAQSKHVTEAKAAKPLKKAEFSCPAKAKGSEFSLGYARASILPDDVNKKKYYIAGYGENKPAKGVLDAPHTHAVWIDDLSGLGGIVLVSLDIVGMLNSDVNELRRRLNDFVKLSRCRSINIVSTHNHAGIDTMGIWGPLPFSGKDPKYMELVFSQTVKAVKQAYAQRKRGSLYLGKIEVPDMQEDIRTPIVYSKTLTRLRFAPADGSNEVYIINFASHSESLQGCNELVSADFPHYLRERIREKTGAETLYCVGAIGGMISMDIPNEQEIRDSGNDFSQSTKEIGEKLADYALAIREEVRLNAKIGLIRQEVYFKAENTILLLAAKIGILKANEFRMPDKSGFAMKSEISYIEIDSLKILLIPCEIFPELVYGGYLGAEESATGYGAEINPVPLKEIVGDDVMIIGLANDELGYVLPPNDYILHPETPYFENARDHHERRHYEETNSLGPETAEKIAQTVAEIINTVEKAKNM
ncbi:MAG: hypothetical protein IJF57_05535 [Clostridia bacterium]|nr:hypothetical protein [Clostridia bacterium]